MSALDFVTVESAASTLGLSTRQAHRLVESGALTRVARGLIDATSLDRYVQSHRHGRTRAWAEHTAWGATALLAGKTPHWMGQTQVSRLRRAMRETTTIDDLLSRMRDRTQVHTFDAHRAALHPLRELLVSTSLAALGITAAIDDSIDGYLPTSSLDAVVRSLGLRQNPTGIVVMRVTEFDFQQVRTLTRSPVVAAMDAATSTDPRIRGVGRTALIARLESL